eukprot:836531-Amorphochlora_amoeboformis.AAC.1
MREKERKEKAGKSGSRERSKRGRRKDTVEKEVEIDKEKERKREKSGKTEKERRKNRIFHCTRRNYILGFREGLMDSENGIHGNAPLFFGFDPHQLARPDRRALRDGVAGDSVITGAIRAVWKLYRFGGIRG